MRGSTEEALPSSPPTLFALSCVFGVTAQAGARELSWVFPDVGHCGIKVSSGPPRPAVGAVLWISGVSLLHTQNLGANKLARSPS